MSNPSTQGISLQGQVAIVTGAGRGVGRAVADALAGAGAAVCLAARSRPELDDAVAAITRRGGTAAAVPTDVTDAAAVAALVEESTRLLGPPSVLVNNAGGWRHVGPVHRADPEVWWSDVEVNLKSAFLCTRAALPAMLERGEGRIVNVSSYAAIAPRPYMTAYASAKAAVLRFTDSLAAELAGTGVLPFAVTPGFVRTSLVETVAASPDARRYLPELSERQDALDPARAGALVVEIAAGRLDPLAGRFLHVLDDVDDLLRRVDEITESDLYALRLRRNA